jgi:hypothetical protein
VGEVIGEQYSVISNPSATRIEGAKMFFGSLISCRKPEVADTLPCAFGTTQSSDAATLRTPTLC